MESIFGVPSVSTRSEPPASGIASIRYATSSMTARIGSSQVMPTQVRPNMLCPE